MRKWFNAFFPELFCSSIFVCVFWIRPWLFHLKRRIKWFYLKIKILVFSVLQSSSIKSIQIKKKQEQIFKLIEWEIYEIKKIPIITKQSKKKHQTNLFNHDRSNKFKACWRSKRLTVREYSSVFFTFLIRLL